MPVSQDLSAAELLDQLEAEQLRLRAVLSARERPAIVERPARGGWSVIENVRHLLFAEQLHLGRFVPGGQRWSELGFTPETMRLQRKFELVESAPVPEIEEVLETWALVHAETRGFLQDDSEQVRKELSRNLRHLRSHIGVIERLLGQESARLRAGNIRANA
jgi:hypothetical protein